MSTDADGALQSRGITDSTSQLESVSDVQRPWEPVKRVVFRFIFVYLTLFSVPFVARQLALKLSIHAPLYTWALKPWEPFVGWVGTHLLGISGPVRMSEVGGSDTLFHWTWVACLILLSLIAASVWSIVDRRRLQYRVLDAWLRTGIRYLLAFNMLAYGSTKVFHNQFGPPRLSELVTPLGDFTPMDLLWVTVGSSFAYTLYSGLTELLAGMLLLFRRTALLGALASVAVLSNVVMLNLGYNVPVKMFSLHLMLMALYVAAPDASRVIRFFFSARGNGGDRSDVTIAPRVPLAARRALTALSMVMGLGVPLWQDWQLHQSTYDERSRPPLYGLYDVTSVRVHGRAPGVNVPDSTRWRRLVVQYPGAFFVYLGDNVRIVRRVAVDTTQHRIVLRPRKDSTIVGAVSYTVTVDGFDVHGMLDGDSVDMTLRRRDNGKLPLLKTGMHWLSIR